VQHRFFDSGAAATALLFKEQLGGLCGKTVLTGGELGVESANRILVAPVWVALDSPHVTVQGTSRVGVLVFEDLDQVFTVPITSAPANYTLTCRHTDTDIEGGNPAVFALEPGLLANNSISDGLAVGYVLYPGGAVGLTNQMLIEAPRMHIEAVSTPGDGQFQLPPFVCSVLNVGGQPSTVVNGVDDPVFKSSFVLDNTANALPSLDQIRFTYVAGSLQPSTITIDYVVETGQTITLDIEDTEGNCSSATLGTAVQPNMLTSDASDFTLETYGLQTVKRKRLRITNGTFVSGKRFRVQATIQTPAGKRTVLTSTGHSTYRLPFPG